jgi:hypothetical protein
MMGCLWWLCNLFLVFVSSQTCSDYSGSAMCYTCSSTASWTSNCRWCMDDNSCHAYGAIYSCNSIVYTPTNCPTFSACQLPATYPIPPTATCSSNDPTKNYCCMTGAANINVYPPVCYQNQTCPNLVSTLAPTSTFNPMTTSTINGFHWYVNSWDECSVNCGTGTQSRLVLCKDANNMTVSTLNCNSPSPNTSQECQGKNQTQCNDNQANKSISTNWLLVVSFMFSLMCVFF